MKKGNEDQTAKRPSLRTVNGELRNGQTAERRNGRMATLTKWRKADSQTTQEYKQTTTKTSSYPRPPTLPPDKSVDINARPLSSMLHKDPHYSAPTDSYHYAPLTLSFCFGRECVSLPRCNSPKRISETSIRIKKENRTNILNMRALLRPCLGSSANVKRVGHVEHHSRFPTFFQPHFPQPELGGTPVLARGALRPVPITQQDKARGYERDDLQQIHGFKKLVVTVCGHLDQEAFTRLVPLGKSSESHCANLDTLVGGSEYRSSQMTGGNDQYDIREYNRHRAPPTQI
ncbi:hypothetical protein HOY82DRAFT_600300 [Tuber indicum]|nr:hypothetical protein HOY82DRAFT_600300 [Tuber indicum]